MELAMSSTLSGTEIRALEFLSQHGGSVLVTQIPDRNERDVFGDVTPGMAVYLRLEKRGLVICTEEDPLDLPGDPLDGFQFTPEVYITDEGKADLAAAR